VKLPVPLIALCLLAGCAQQAAQEPPLPPPKPPLEFLGEWGTPGNGPGQLSRPVSVAVDFVGNIYVADAGSRFIHKFDPEGKPLLSFQDPLLQSPAGVALDRGGAIYAIDSKGDLLFVFGPDGERFRVLRSAAGRRFRSLSAVSVDSEGIVFALDASGIRRFGLSRRQPSSDWPLFFARKERDWPLLGRKEEDEAGGDLAVGPDGMVYAISGEITVVERYTATGEHLNLINLDSASITESSRPQVTGIAVSDRLVFVADGISERIVIATTEGDLKHTQVFPLLPVGGTPSKIVDVAWSPRGELLLLDQINARVLRFRVNF